MTDLVHKGVDWVINETEKGLAKAKEKAGRK